MTTGSRLLAHTPSGSIDPGGTVLVPLGATEQHGPHLPLGVDALVASRVARDIANGLAPYRQVWVAPALPFGSSGEHEFARGTISIGQAATKAVLIEATRSISRWAGEVIFVNAHGGNMAPLISAVRQLRSEAVEVSWISCRAGWLDAHAGRTETSLMLAIDPTAVGDFSEVVGNTSPLAGLLPALAAGGVGAVAPNGVLGDPRGASAEEGRSVLRAMANEGVQRCLSSHIDEHGQRVPPPA
ncbi:MAG: mycofactocin biosynthesis peptidyl-dipeptidase MftE [Bifidobacteriaceae bacterium]|jgi:creatinine amidohydrolase|nr:mycofactocin biosynthesis peptidyl-dipeptidase MftE [Bifidobacteriaceae bacterium]